ncbi:MAG: hypothetical protein KF767_00070 [Bdellovibrionaceae bacterium]|jgi:hypothetical protein|nr:hypothetical protein [Pseudobdellovibrionaceae bacterium]
MKTILKISLVALTMTLAACGNNLTAAETQLASLETDEKSQRPLEPGILSGPLKRLVYERSGWYPAPGAPFGIRMELNFRADLGLTEFSAYDLTREKPNGKLRCARVFIEATHLKEVAAAAQQLRYGKTDIGMVDGGDAYLTLTNSAGKTVKGLLDSSDSAYGQQQVIVDSQVLTTKLNHLLGVCEQGVGQ